MQDFTPACENFYTTPKGQVCTTLVAERMRWLWPDLRGQAVLGVGMAAPYLAMLGDPQTNKMAVCPKSLLLAGAGQALSGVVTCQSNPCDLPFQDAVFDRVVLVHALRGAENFVPQLREAARVLQDDGRLMLLVPNRLAGPWRLRGSPFAADRAFTRRGLRSLLAAAMLRAERWDEALFLPVGPSCRSVQAGRRADIAGKVLCPGGGSLLLVEAVRDMYSVRPVGLTARRRWLSRLAVPVAGAARLVNRGGASRLRQR